MRFDVRRAGDVLKSKRKRDVRAVRFGVDRGVCVRVTAQDGDDLCIRRVGPGCVEVWSRKAPKKSAPSSYQTEEIDE